MTQIISVYKFSELVRIELYENKMVDLEFKDGREILELSDPRIAKALSQKIETLHKEFNKDSESKVLLMRKRTSKNLGQLLGR